MVGVLLGTDGVDGVSGEGFAGVDGVDGVTGVLGALGDSVGAVAGPLPTAAKAHNHQCFSQCL